MIRTRDFILFLCTVFFLCSGIAATVVTDVARFGGGQAGAVVLADPAQLPPPVEQSGAVVVESSTIDREANMAAMRKRLAALDLADVAATTEEVPVLPEGEPLGATEDEVAGLQTCATYSEVSWADMPGVQFKVAEGARLVYRPLAPAAAPVSAATTASSSVPEAAPAPTELVLAQLPLREAPMPSPTCIPYDVVGIALDGSLIRNDEAALYSVFGADTLIGYALDGFPLYGVSGLPTDDCGGALVGGTYRYYLSAARETILNCYAAVPVGL